MHGVGCLAHAVRQGEAASEQDMRRVLSATEGAMRKALVISIAAHLVILAFARPFSRRAHAALEIAAPTAEEPDRWHGSTVELPSGGDGRGERVYDVNVEQQPASPPAAPTRPVRQSEVRPRRRASDCRGGERTEDQRR